MLSEVNNNKLSKYIICLVYNNIIQDCSLNMRSLIPDIEMNKTESFLF